MRFGLIGYGVVGGGVLELLRTRKDALERAAGPFELIGVAVRDPGKGREGLDPSLLRDIDALLSDPKLDVLVEVAGGVEQPFDWVSRALTAGKTVVTANKALLAERAEELEALLQRHGGRLFCEAAVAGEIDVRYWGAGIERTAWDNRIKYFNSKYPNVKVNKQLLTKNGYDEFPALLTQIAAGNAPDVIRVLNFQPTQLVTQGDVLLPLDDFIKDFREDYRSDTSCADDYEVAECSNGPDETDTGAASGGTPQGQGQQQQTPTPTPQPQSQP